MAGAINIGNVNFGVGADTRGLQNAVAKLQRFSKQVSQVAKVQSKAGRTATKAMGAQEAAMKTAIIRVIDLKKQWISLGKKGEKGAQQMTTPLRRYITAMTQAKVTTLGMKRAQSALNQELAVSRRNLNSLKVGDSMSETLRNLESSAVLALGPLSGVGARIRSLSAIAGRSTIILAAFAGAVVGVSVVLGKMILGAQRVSVELEKMNARFLFATGTQEGATKEMEFVISTAQSLGLQINDLGKAYSRLTASAAGSNLEGEETRRIFVAVSKAAAALRLSNEEVEGTFRAIEQMISKGTVQAEELRGQLGERLPGAFRLAAEAMGTTTKGLGDMLKAGEVLTDDFLPKFTIALERAIGAHAQGNLKSFTGLMNRLANNTLLFNKEFDELTKTSSAFKFAAEEAGDAVEFMTRNLKIMLQVAGAVAATMLVMSGPAILQGFKLLGAVIVGLTTRLAGMAAVASFTAAILSPIGLLQIAAAAAVATTAYKLLGLALGKVGDSAGFVSGVIDRSLSPTMGTLHKDTQTAIDDIVAIQGEFKSLLDIMSRPGVTLDDFLRRDASISFEKLIEDVPSDEVFAFLDVLAEKMGMAGTSAIDMVIFVKELIFAQNNLETSAKDLQRRMAATPKIILEINETMGLLAQQIEATSRGARALELFERHKQGVVALQKFNELMAKSNLTFLERIRLSHEYEAQLRTLAEAQDRFTGAGASMAQALSKGFEDAIFAAESFKETLKGVLIELIKIAFRAQVLKPFEQAVSGGLGALFSKNNLFGSGATSDPGANVFQGAKGFAMLGTGGVLTQPSFFGHSKGVGVAGESGPEAVLPLTRVGGKLGVSAEGSGGGDIIINNNIDARGATAEMMPLIRAEINASAERTKGQISKEMRLRRFRTR